MYMHGLIWKVTLSSFSPTVRIIVSVSVIELCEFYTLKSFYVFAWIFSWKKDAAGDWEVLTGKHIVQIHFIQIQSS